MVGEQPLSSISVKVPRSRAFICRNTPSCLSWLKYVTIFGTPPLQDSRRRILSCISGQYSVPASFRRQRIFPPTRVPQSSELPILKTRQIGHGKDALAVRVGDLFHFF